MSKKIYVGNISFNAQEHDLEKVFTQYGEVVSVKIIADKYTNQSKGFGFVEMMEEDAATAAISSLNGTELMNRELRVNEAKDRNDNSRNNNYRY